MWLSEVEVSTLIARLFDTEDIDPILNTVLRRIISPGEEVLVAFANTGQH
jgi:hypothetical protein